MRPTVLLFVLAACAGAGPSSRKTSAVPADVRVYNLPEAQAKALVQEALAKRGVVLAATADPHVLATAPKRTTIDHTTFIPTTQGLMIGEEPLVTFERTWMVIFEPLGAESTAIRVVRGEQVAWANDVQRSVSMQSAMEAVTTDARLPLNFVRDRDQEAAVEADLDSQVSVEVSEQGEPEGPAPEPVSDPPLVAEAPPQPQCRLDPRGLERLFAPGHFVLLSDPLGAPEPIAVLDDFSCLVLSRAVPLTVALSIPSREQGRINDYLASSGDPRARRELLKGPFWVRSWQDGRSSLAMYDELERVRRRRFLGQPVTILAIDSDSPGNARQAHIAAALLRHREQQPERLIVAMLGNALTTRRTGAAWDRGLMPVGARLAAVLPAQTHAFDVSFWPGRHWTCHLEAKGHLRCGTWAVGPGPAQATQALSPRPFFRLFSGVSAQGFDGLYFVGGGLTPSAPAQEAMRTDEGTRLFIR